MTEPPVGTVRIADQPFVGAHHLLRFGDTVRDTLLALGDDLPIPGGDAGPKELRDADWLEES